MCFVASFDRLGGNILTELYRDLNTYTIQDMSTFPNSAMQRIGRAFFIVLFFACCAQTSFAEGTKQMSPDSTDECMLHTNASGFGNFAEYNGGDSTALLVRVTDVMGPERDTLYIGLSRQAENDGSLQLPFGSYNFRIVDPAGNVVHGPFAVNIGNANCETWELAVAGPDVLDPMNGYSTAASFATFVPDTVGDFRIEFSDGVANQVVNVKWFDFTIVNGGEEKPGRLWSTAWALRTPEAGGDTPPECDFDRPFQGVLFSYTMDGFVSKIDFDSSGFQGLSFNVAFGLKGPGTSGDLVIDRMSIKDANATFSAADHMVFVNEPDTLEFPSPDDLCGEAEILGVTCISQDSFCIEVGATRMGQVEILLDFFGDNGEFDPDTTDVLLALAFDMADTACIYWNGLKGNGEQVEFGEEVPTYFRYAQGVQHYAAFDVELLKFGYCVETVRPICPGVSTDLLYWDDSNITDDLSTGSIDEGDPGTGQPKVQLDGCTCGVDSCRTWTNFQVGDPPTGTCQGTPYGYGEGNTLNTWWFASTSEVGPLMLPLVQVTIVGDTFFCPGDSTELTAMGIPDTLDYEYSWSGPGGFSANTQSTGMIGVAGVYSVTITDTVNNCTAFDSVEVLELTPPSTSITFTCSGMNMQNGDLDLTVSGAGPPFTYMWSNGEMTEDISNVPPGTYYVTVTDTLGCTAVDSATVEGCCELMIMCPPSNGGLFSCLDDVPAPDTTLIMVLGFCDSITITSLDTDNGGAGCALDTLEVMRTYTVTDAVGTTMQCVQFFQVVDDEAPVLAMGTCPQDTSVLCGMATDTAALGVPTFMDVCDGVMLDFVDDSTGFDGSCSANVIGTITRTFMAMDSCGNVDSSCIQVISVIDTIAPTFTTPMDITIQCDDDSSPMNTGEVSDTMDNCSPLTLDFVDVIVPGPCDGTDTIQRTWTATDACGNSSSGLQIITRIDDTAPTFTTPADVTIDCLADTDPSSTGMPTNAMDNCSDVTITFSDVIIPNGCPASDTIRRTWIVSDACGNAASDLQIILRIDTIAPTFTVPVDVTIDCQADTSQANTGTVNDAADNCSDFTLTVTDMVVPGDCPATDTIYRSFNATDECGNSNIQVQTIVLEDNTGPMITFCPPDTTVDCDASIDPADLGMATATDDCSGFTITFTDTEAGQCATDAPITRTWIATDDCGNVTTCIQTITIQDTVAPMPIMGTMPMDTTVDCTASTDTADLGVPVYRDNCSIGYMLTVEDDSTGFDGSCSTGILGTITRTFLAEDDCGNIDSSVVQVIMVQDTTPPTFTVPADTIIACDQDSLPSTTGMVTDAADDCDPMPTVDFVDNVVENGCPAIDTIYRNWIVTDACGNVSAQTQVIIRTDDEAPTFTTPADTLVDCDSPLDPEFTGEIQDTMDNCSEMMVSFLDNVIPGACPSESTIERTWSVMDECGNVATGLQIITVQDTTPPSITGPADTIIACDESTDPMITGMPTGATDNCGEVVTTYSDATVAGECPATDTIYRTWIASDECGNMSSVLQVITLVDTVAPMLLTCPPDTVFECAAPADTLGLPTYADACGMVEISFVDDSTGFMPPGVTGTITRTFFGTDECGNVDSSCVQTITIQDTEPPVITSCPEAITLECPEVADTSVTGVPSAMDMCTPDSSLILTITDDSTGFDQPCFGGTITRTFVIADLEGNSATCSQVITIEDTTPPTFTTPADITLDCSADIDDLTITGEITGVDDCSEISDTTYSDALGVDGCDGTGTIIRSWVVADACGNSATQTQLITLIDDVPPSVTAPADITISCELNPADTSITGGDVSASDNCSTIFIYSFADSMLTMDCGVTGTIQRTWSAEDECGNVGTAVQLITVIDTTPPVALCMDVTLDLNLGDVILSPEDVDAGSFDACGDVTLELSDSIFTCFDFVDDSIMIIQLTVTDECGLQSVCDVQVTGQGGAGLVINCPAQIFKNLGPGLCEGLVFYEVSVEPLCGDVDNIIIEQVDTSGLTSGDYFPIGTTIQTWIAYTPVGGDTVSCSFPVTVVEHPEGEFVTCNDTVNVSVDDNCEAFIGPDMILEGDEYGCFDDFLIEVEGYGSGLGGVLITEPEFGEYFNVTVTNEAGASCWGVMQLEDKIPPIITCIDVTLSCGDDTEPVYEEPIQGVLEYEEFPDAPIGPDAGTVTTQEFQVVAPANAMITDVNVLVDLNHTWSADLEVSIIGPDGTEVNLASDVCGSADDWEDVVFDDEAAIPVASACSFTPPALQGPVQPQGVLADFDGGDASGTWTLVINDDAGGDAGTLNMAGLQIEYFVALPYAPIAYDACGETTLSYEETETGEECDSSQIIRTWTVTDGYGNTASCVQTITIVPLTLDGLEFPGVYEGECGGSTHPSVTGYPTLDGQPISGNVCNIFSTWEDKEFDGCGGGLKIIRSWSIMDWCTQEIVDSIQIIKLTDEDAPILDCPADRTVGSDPWNCTAEVDLITPDVTDPCGSAVTLTPEASQGTLIDFGGSWRLADAPLGTTFITWTAEDECGNSSGCVVAITVVDDVPPVPLCDEHTVVSLTTDLIEHGLTKVPAETFDDGSYDNCGGVTLTARRMDSCIDFDHTTAGSCIDDDPNGIVNTSDRGTAFRPCVPFACCDVGTPVMVELRVEDEAGNVNSCMVEVTVQDKLPPSLVAPPSVVVSCEFWFDAAETNGFVPQEEDVLTPVFGRVLDAYEYDPSDRQDIIIDDPGNDELPQPYNWGKEGWTDDNCDATVTVRVRIWDDCSGETLPPGAPSPYAVRLIERTFLSEDSQGNTESATQRIWVVDYEPFYISDTDCTNKDRNDGVIWPCDEDYQLCLDSFPVNYPTIIDDNCSLVAVTYEDEEFNFVDGVCKKILRTWTVIDWCQYDATTGAGLWSYVQVIKINDQFAPLITDCPQQPITLCAADDNVSLPANNQALLGEDNPLASSCSVHVRLEHTVIEPCSDVITYDVKVYPNNGSDFLQVLEKTDYELPDNNIGTIVFDSEQSSILAVRLNGLPYNDKYCTPIIGGEKDYHRVLWTVEDGCGNMSTCSYLFRLEDCKQPTPVCVGLSSVVMPSSGTVTIWASDFNASSFDDCTPADALLYSFDGDEYTPGMEFDCELIDSNGSTTFLVEIWVADEGNDQDCNGIITWDERNKDFCTTFVNIEDNNDACDDVGPLSGEVYTEEAAAVEEVIVSMTNALGIEMDVSITGDDGRYGFINPLLDHTIIPKRNDDHMNGVSTLDLVRIQRHLLGLEPFTSPYKMIAADANNSESVSAIDLVELRKLILGLYIELPNNESWRFVDSDFEFADPANPWPFDEIIEIEAPMTNHEDFVAIKVGDVNGTVSANILAEEDGATGLNEQRDGLTIVTEDRQVVAGEEVEVRLSGTNFSNMLGYQFTMQTEGLALSSVDAGGIDVDEENVAVHGNAVTMSWHRVNAASVAKEDVLVTMTFTAQRSGKLSEMLAIGSQITEAEAYTEDGAEITTMPVKLAFETPTGTDQVEFALYQNAPNPVTDHTTIGFELPESMSATLTLYDVAGKVLDVVEGDYNAGYNEVQIARRDLKTAGVVYYRLDAGAFSGTKKMIILE